MGNYVQLQQWRRGLYIKDPEVASGDNTLSEITGGFVVDTPKATYSIATQQFAPVASPTDILTIQAGAKNVRLIRVRISGTATTAASWELALVKRSTLDTGGTSSGVTPVPHWSSDPAVTASVKQYSANPAALGTTVGNLRDDIVFLAGSTLGVPIDWTPAARAWIIPANSTEQIAINALATSIPSGGKVTISLEWIEDN